VDDTAGAVSGRRCGEEKGKIFIEGTPLYSDIMGKTKWIIEDEKIRKRFEAIDEIDEIVSKATNGKYRMYGEYRGGVNAQYMSKGCIYRAGTELWRSILYGMFQQKYLSLTTKLYVHSKDLDLYADTGGEILRLHTIKEKNKELADIILKYHRELRHK